MNAALGVAFVAAGLAASLLGFVTVGYALVRKRPHLLRLGTMYAVVVIVASVLQFAVMERALVVRDFRLAYVQKVGSRLTPARFNVPALWSSLEGSILLWVLILAGYLGLVVWRFRTRREDPLVGWAVATLFGI